MKQKAFTLIELLVVISIIAILMGIMMPALSRARAMAGRVVCATNLKTIGLVVEMYANDYNDMISEPTPGSGSADGIHINYDCRDWYLRYLPYTEDPKIYQCPAFRKTIIDDENNSLKLVTFSPSTGKHQGKEFTLTYTAAVYAYAGYDYDRYGYTSSGIKYDPAKGGRKWKLNEIKSFAAKDDWRGIIFGDGLYRVNTDDWAPRDKVLAVRRENNQSTAGRALYVHGNSANFLVADGRVGHQEDDYVWKEAYNGTDSGYNRFPPTVRGLVPSMLK